MALPQSIDPTTLNLSGRPAIATDPTTTTSAVDLGMPNPTIGMEKNTVSPLLGSLFGALLGYGYDQKNAGTTAVNKPTTGTPSGGTPSGGTPSGGLPTGGTPTGNIGSVNSISFPAGTTQADIDAIHGKENGQSKYQISGVNMQNGQVIATPNYNIGGTNLGTNTGNFGFEADTGTTTGGGATTGGDTTIGGGTTTTPTDTTQLANQYFQDSQGNIYDASGNLIYTSPKNQAPVTDDYITGGGYEPTPTTRPEYLQDSQGNVYDENGTLIYYNPSTAIPGTNDGGGGYDPSVPETEQYYEDSSGNIFDYSGNLVLEFGNGYYYEPDTGNFYDSNFDSVGNDFNAYQDFFNIPTYGGSDNYNYDFGDLGDYFDYGNYTSGSTTYIKDGGSVRGGLATPLFRNGGSVPRFDNGGFIDQVVANQVPQSVTSTGTSNTTPVAMETQTNLTNPSTTSTTTGSVLDSILGFAKNNPTVTGAGLGAILTALINSQTEQPVNRGVDMSALGTLKPRTTPTGAARFVPYSEYGTPTAPYDYSQLYANLGVSPFGADAGVLSPSAAPTSPVSAQPITTPTGGLTAPSTMSPTGTVTTPPASSSPQYFQDADGNIYNANGDLLYDTTTGSTTPTAQQAVAPSSAQASVAPMSGLAVITPEASSSYYSYGSSVDPAQILSSKSGGTIRKFADGGLSDLAVTSLSDVMEPMMIESAAYDYPKFSADSGVTYDDNTKMATDAYGNTMSAEDFIMLYKDHPQNLQDSRLRSITDKPYSPEYPIDYFDKPTYSTPPEYLRGQDSDLAYALGSPETYRGGMPMQTTAMPTQGPAMPTQGPAMPSQAPFSSSPTFRFSGANNPLLSGLSMTPRQPYTLAEGGSPHGNANIPVTEGHNPNVPIIQGRQDYREGAYVQGEGDGQSDDIPAMLADGEYVIDAETVAQLGNGSNKAGAKMLDTFRKNIRAHKRSAPTHKIPPKSKSPLAYLKGAK